MKKNIELKNKSLQLYTSKAVNGSYTPIKVTNLKNAKRLLSKLIYELQAGTIEGQRAKDLCYLLISYVNVFKSYEIENRLTELEKKARVNL